MRRLIVPEDFIVVGEHRLPDDLAHYVRDVLRLGDDVRLSLADGAGHVAVATVRLVGKRWVVLAIEPPEFVPRDDPFELTLIQCVAKGDKMDTVVRQTTELGVARIVPVLSARAVAKQHGKVDRWRTIADDAIRVSGRAWRPEIRPVAALADVLNEPRADLSLAFQLDADLRLAQAVKKRKPRSIEVLIGPEGGLTDDEVEAAAQAGFLSVQLGPHTLRTETAAPAVAALLLLDRP